ARILQFEEIENYTICKPSQRCTELAAKVSDLLSEVKYQEVALRSDATFIPLNLVSISNKYKEDGLKSLSHSLYSQLPETTETTFAKTVSELQSEVKFYKEKYNREKGKSDYSNMKTLPEVEHAMEVNRNQSDVKLLHTHAALAMQNQAVTKQTTPHHYLDSTSSIGRNKHLSVLQVKYKYQHLKGQKPCYNPMDCVSFKHSQAAAALASQVGVLSLKPSFLVFNLLVSVCSQLEYKKKYKQTKAHYHNALDTAEQLHHRENAVLHSQVKYKEEYEKNKGRSLMEFGDTQTYKVSKEAQKMQSEREYRRDFEEQVKGRALLDVDQTPGYLTARNASSLLTLLVSLQKVYRKDLEQEVKGRGLSGLGLEETPELLRVKKANQILNQVRANVEIKLRLQIKVDLYFTPEVSPLVLQKEYRRDLETEIRGKGMELSTDVLEIQRAKRASEIQSQKKYKDEAEQLKGRYSQVPETLEMERVRANQRHISSVQYKEQVGHGTAVMDTPEMERVRRNQDNISSVSTRQPEPDDRRGQIMTKPQAAAKATSLGMTPEVERVKQNQENISSARCKQLWVITVINVFLLKPSSVLLSNVM
uniref:Nebulette n=1 Tax=Cyprinodon variegatus TaxID=28743 RepID=A0A3Q2GIE5_CYPVA